MISQRAYPLSGKCIIEVASGEPFEYMTSHISFGTARVAQPLDNQSALCGNKIGLNPRFAGNTAYRYGPVSGGTSYALQDFSFNSAELATFGQSSVQMYPGNPFYNAKIYGPRYERNHVVIPLNKVTLGDTALTNYENVFWDNFTPDPDQPNLPEDWLGHLLPGVYGMCSKTYAAQPFKAINNYEESGSSILNEWNQKNFVWLKWCNPLTVYSGSTQLGKFIGTAYIVFFTPACLRNPRYLVDDPRSVSNPPPKLQSELQYWYIDLWTYFVGRPDPGKTLYSPRVKTQRWWYFTQTGPGPNTDTVSPKTPYWFLRCQLDPFYVKCNLTSGGTTDMYVPNSQGELAIVA